MASIYAGGGSNLNCSSVLKALVRRVHSDPLDADAWTFAGLLAVPAGVSQESRAARLLETAAAVCRSLEPTQQATPLRCTFAGRYLQSASPVGPMPAHSQVFEEYAPAVESTVERGPARMIATMQMPCWRLPGLQVLQPAGLP